MPVSTQTELLAAYAAGETSPGLSLLCAAQLSIDPEGASFVSMAEEVAGRALREEQSAASAPMNVDAMMARLDEAYDEQCAHAPAAAPNSPFPAVLREVVGGDADDVPWRFRLPGLSEHMLADFDGEKVSLLRGKPGSRVPQHTHRGVEATLVLQGALQDGDRVLERGDFSVCGAEHDHRPQVVGDGVCYCLIVVDGGLRFTGTFGRALNLFNEDRP